MKTMSAKDLSTSRTLTSYDRVDIKIKKLSITTLWTLSLKTLNT